MIKFAPILLALIYGLVMYRFSAWRTAKDLDAQSTELDEPVLKNLSDRMAASLDVPLITGLMTVSEPVNGVAAPDGRIFITRGFYDKDQAGEFAAEELASVIAHEVGHVALGHTRRRMIDFSGQNAMRQALGMVLSRVIPGFGMWVADGITKLLVARLSRGDEYEADAYAAALLSKSGIGVAPQKALFSKLEALSNAKRGVTPAWLMSHPKIEDRIAAIEKLEASWQPPPTIP